MMRRIRRRISPGRKAGRRRRWPRRCGADYLVSTERADKLSGAWGRHPLLGRMYLPAYRAGTELVAQWRRDHAPDRILRRSLACAGWWMR